MRLYSNLLLYLQIEVLYKLTIPNQAEIYVRLYSNLLLYLQIEVLYKLTIPNQAKIYILIS